MVARLVVVAAGCALAAASWLRGVQQARKRVTATTDACRRGACGGPRGDGGRGGEVEGNSVAQGEPRRRWRLAADPLFRFGGRLTTNSFDFRRSRNSCSILYLWVTQNSGHCNS